jgi:hypothetical protein
MFNLVAALFELDIVLRNSYIEVFPSLYCFFSALEVAIAISYTRSCNCILLISCDMDPHQPINLRWLIHFNYIQIGHSRFLNSWTTIFFLIVQSHLLFFALQPPMIPWGRVSLQKIVLGSL